MHQFKRTTNPAQCQQRVDTDIQDIKKTHKSPRVRRAVQKAAPYHNQQIKRSTASTLPHMSSTDKMQQRIHHPSTPKVSQPQWGWREQRDRQVRKRQGGSSQKAARSVRRNVRGTSAEYTSVRGALQYAATRDGTHGWPGTQLLYKSPRQRAAGGRPPRHQGVPSGRHARQRQGTRKPRRWDTGKGL